MAGASVKLGFEETELRLGLPNTSNTNPNGKRGFDETHRCRHHHDMDLKLNLCNSNSKEIITKSDTDLMISHDEKEKISSMDQKHFVPGSNDISAKPPAKAQVIGWPPVRSFRKNILAVQKSSMEEESEKINAGNGAFVKVSMDGAPYLRKVDLKMYKSYQDLSHALANMFSSSTIGKCGPQGMKDFMNESKLMDLLSGSDYVPTYEDKDGDWMLIGDVPWEMFVKSCKRLRIMKGKEAIGLAPRAMEKCRNRN